MAGSGSASAMLLGGGRSKPKQPGSVCANSHLFVPIHAASSLMSPALVPGVLPCPLLARSCALLVSFSRLHCRSTFHRSPFHVCA